MSRTNIFPILGEFFVNNFVCQSNHFCKTYNKAKYYEKSQIFKSLIGLERNCFEKFEKKKLAKKRKLIKKKKKKKKKKLRKKFGKNLS